MHDNEILKRVVYDSRGSIKVDNMEEASILREVLSPEADESKYTSRSKGKVNAIAGLDESFV